MSPQDGRRAAADHNAQVADWLLALSADLGSPALPAVSEPGPSRATRPGYRLKARRPRGPALAAVPLAAVLAVQAVLSLRLVWSNTAFEDEALYLWAGQLEIAHWLHGTPIPAFPTYFSGTPVLYPVLGALVDRVGGLALARILSLCFMLGATSLLWAVTRRLYGPRAAFFAAGVWAVLGPTIRLGAFATYDPMALFLVALAVWLAIGGQRRRDATGWMLAASAVLVLANATKYASSLFDPVVVAIAVLTGYPQPGGKAAWRRGALLGGGATVLISLLLKVTQGLYLMGIDQTTLARPASDQPVSEILLSSWDWIGVVVVAGLVAVALGLASQAGPPAKLLLILLVSASLLVPAEQARIHTFTSLSKHVDFGAWFAAIAVGYLADRLIRWGRRRLTCLTLMAGLTGLLVPVAVTGTAQAAGMYAWPNAANLVLTLRGMVNSHSRILADNSPPLEYYFPGVPWERWSSVYGLRLPSGHDLVNSGYSFAPYRRALAHHYFSLVVLAFTDKPSLDALIAAYLHTDPDYQFVGTVPFANSGSHGSYLIWEYVRPDGGRP
jgi:hypothetical protein